MHRDPKPLIAYLFWHRPDRSVTPARYEALLASFHETLRARPPDGFLGSTCHRLSAIPWLGGAPGYEDRYLLENSCALDLLNAAAVDVYRQEAHGATAALSGAGAGGLYRLLRSGASDAGRDSDALWCEKPRSLPGAEFLAELDRRLPEPAQLWRRQMVLGPAPEFGAIQAGDEERPDPLPRSWTARWLRKEAVWPRPGDDG